MTDDTAPTTLAASPGPRRTTTQTTRGFLAYLAVPLAVGLALLALSAPLVLAGALVGLVAGVLGAGWVARRSTAVDRPAEAPAPR